MSIKNKLTTQDVFNFVAIVISIIAIVISLSDKWENFFLQEVKVERCISNMTLEEVTALVNGDSSMLRRKWTKEISVALFNNATDGFVIKDTSLELILIKSDGTEEKRGWSTNTELKIIPTLAVSARSAVVDNIVLNFGDISYFKESENANEEIMKNLKDIINTWGLDNVISYFIANENSVFVTDNGEIYFRICSMVDKARAKYLFER